MTIFRYIILFSLTLGLFSGCDHCEETTKTWKHEAIKAVTDLKKVTKEISDHSGIFNPPKFDKDNLYLDIGVFENLPQESKNRLPLLRQWFKKTSDNDAVGSYISFENHTITADFKNCNYKSISYSGYLYYSTTGIMPSFTHGGKLIAELKDSFDLGDNWYYVFLRCDGCGD